MQITTIRVLSCLIVEDELLAGLDIEEIIETAVYESRWVASLDTAPAALTERSPDVAIIDIRLRDRSCADLVRELRRGNIPFIVHSGSEHDAGPTELSDTPWLSKPAEPHVVLHALDNVLQNRRREQIGPRHV